MPYEAWIWTELLAFDNTEEDLGVGAYLTRLGSVPKGISIMASASDFVMLHEALDEERPLFPDVCTRFGHAGNEERARQDWTNWQLRELVRLLQARGVEVWVSVFAAYHHDAYHHEWLSDHPEARIVYAHMGVTDGVQVLARLDDGTLYESLFVAQLVRVMDDYGFDGFHGPDCWGPSGSLGWSDCSDGMTAQFADWLGARCPAELRRTLGWDQPALAQRMEFICAHLYRDWIAFHIVRWEQFWRAIVDAVKPLGKRTMINSANTKAAFESMYGYGMDYRRIAAMGVDYLVVETVAANLALINGGHERHFDFAATLAEMKALLPGMKLIFLHGVKDVTESYDLLRHAPGRLEREVFTLANQMLWTDSGELQRCADGFMVCLGDGLKAHEWQYLRRQWDAGYGATPVRAGELTWVFSEAAVEALLEDYPRHGTWPGFRQVGHLVEHEGLQIHTLCRTDGMQRVSGPLIVPNADLLSEVEAAQIAQYDRGPVVLIGREQRVWQDAYQPAATLITCRITEGYTLACAVLDGALETERAEILSPDAPAFSDPRQPLAFWDRPDAMPIPDAFWAAAGAAIRRSVEAWQDAQGVTACRAINATEGLRLLTTEDATGVLRTALVSTIPTYLLPEFRFTKPPVSAEKISDFPYTPLTVSGEAIRSGHNLSPLHVPPYGIIVMDVTFEGDPDA